MWSEGNPRNESGGGGGGGERCSCDAFLPGSTFPVGDLVVIEQTAVEISHELELEMGKVFSHKGTCALKDYIIVTKNIFECFFSQLNFSWGNMKSK